MSITFDDPDGNRYDEKTKGAQYKVETDYTTIKIATPTEGEWKITYTSKKDQTIKPTFVYQGDMAISLSKNQQDVTQQIPLNFIAKITERGADVTDETILKNLKVNLVVTKQGSNKADKTEMKLENGEFTAEYSFSGYGPYEVKAELVNAKGDTVESSVMTIDVQKNKDIIPLWIILLIIFLIILLIVGIIVLINWMRSKPGSGYVSGNVSIKITGKLPNDENMIFQTEQFNCDQVFSKKNSLSNLVTEYIKRYRINNTSELAEMTLTQFINSALSEVTNNISICGNKKKQTIVTIPAGYEMEVDGLPVNKVKVIKFSEAERAIMLRFNNQGTTYTIDLVFSKGNGMDPMGSMNMGGFDAF